MALADHFDEADVLDSLSWMGYSHETRVAKLANIFLEKENFIRNKARTYDGPSTSNVRLLIKSLFSPPRGTQQQTIKDTIKEIERQRETRKGRAENPPYKPGKPLSRITNVYRRRSVIIDRMNAVARTRYKTVYRERDRRENRDVIKRASHKVVGMGRIGDVLVIVDQGDYYSHSRIYMQHKPTGKEKVIVLDGDIKEFDDALRHIAPKVSLRAMFAGATLALDFENDGFLVDGETVPYKGVARIYTRKHNGVIRTWRKPEKKDN